MKPTLGLVSMTVSGYAAGHYWSNETVLVRERSCLRAAAEVFVILGPDTEITLETVEGEKWSVTMSPALQFQATRMLVELLPPALQKNWGRRAA